MKIRSHSNEGFYFLGQCSVGVLNSYVQEPPGIEPHTYLIFVISRPAVAIMPLSPDPPHLHHMPLLVHSERSS